jgi:hypothetical protein
VSRLIRYPEERAVEDAAFGMGLVPTWLCRVLLPVWKVDVRATIYDSEAYDLIDRYVELAIARGALDNAAGIAAFYGLDQTVVDNALRFLESIGHLSRDAGRLTLTDLGANSVNAGRRYVRRLEDRRKLYFDGLTHLPLTRPYYDDRTVTYLDGAGLAPHLTAAGREQSWGAFTPVIKIPVVGFGPDSVASLAALPVAERDRFNLPEQVMAPELADAPEQVYLPAYLVRVVDQADTLAYLAYTQASQEADPEWSQACASTEEVRRLVENEYQAGRDEGEQTAARRWVEKRFSGKFEVEWRQGQVVATLPASAFAETTDAFEPRRIGSFIKMDGWYFQLWCADERQRRRGLLQLTDSYLGARARINPESAAKRLARFGRQTGFGPLSPAEIVMHARQAGKATLAAQLDRLTGS